MKIDGKILIVDDDQDILVAGKLLLNRKFSEVSICNRPEQIPKLIKENDFDAILLDMNFGPGESSGEQGFYWLKEILVIKPNSIVVMITAHGGVDIAVDAMKQGATDFIAKPWQNEKVVATLSTAVQLGKSRFEAAQLKVTNQALVQTLAETSGQASNQHTQQMIIGQSKPMQDVHALIHKAAPTDANVLILGENGTGKELIARDIHSQSQRARNIFMSIDLGAISESLFESELFGHKKGAFTGAQQDRIGKLKAADGGTLFLDEIGNLPLYLQAKLLTVLEQRQVTPLGSNKAQPFNVRVIAATNISPEVLNNESKFRQDLLFRLNTVTLNLPPLRERKEDIVPIAEHFIALYSKKYNKSVNSLTSDTKQVLLQEPWQGNIRALRHAIERAVILTEHADLQISDFQLEQKAQQNFNQMTDKASNAFLPANAHMENDLTEELTLEEMEKQAITAALKKHRYNISHCAKALGLTRAALYRRMEKYGL